MKVTFEQWLNRLNRYAVGLGFGEGGFEDDETTRERFEDGEAYQNAFQELMNP